jgi:hypothetical protein
MQVSKINYQNTPEFKAGLYFSRSSSVLFNRNHNITFRTPDQPQVSSEGFRYFEDKNISEELKEKFANIPFIKKLAQKFDTFIWTGFSKEGLFGKKNIVVTKIAWADLSKKAAQKECVVAGSNISKEDSFDKMFEKLNKEIFIKKI